MILYMFGRIVLKQALQAWVTQRLIHIPMPYLALIFHLYIYISWSLAKITIQREYVGLQTSYEGCILTIGFIPPPSVAPSDIRQRDGISWAEVRKYYTGSRMLSWISGKVFNSAWGCPHKMARIGRRRSFTFSCPDSRQCIYSVVPRNMV